MGIEGRTTAHGFLFVSNFYERYQEYATYLEILSDV